MTSPDGHDSYFSLEDYRLDLVDLFLHLDANTSQIIGALLASVKADDFDNDDLIAAALEECRSKIEKIEKHTYGG